MSNDNNDWIKMSERCPTNADMPIFRLQEMGGKVRLLYDASFNECADGWWRKADIPAPPKPEPTQRSQSGEDTFAFSAWAEEKEYNYSAKDAWFAALAYRDAQNRKDIIRIACGEWDEDMRKAYWSIRRRCGLDT